MSYVSTLAKQYKAPKRYGHKRNSSYKQKTITTSEETTFGGTLCLTKEQWEKGMALSRKMKNMSAW